jgi:hypothetical protein
LLSYAILWNKTCIISRNGLTLVICGKHLAKEQSIASRMGPRNAQSEKIAIHLFNTFGFFIPSPPRLAVECSRPQSRLGHKIQIYWFRANVVFSEWLGESITQPQFEPLSLMWTSLKATPSVNDLCGRQNKIQP